MPQKRLLFLLAALLPILSVGCSHTVSYQAPSPSERQLLGGSTRQATLKVVDKRTGEDTVFHQKIANLAKANVTVEGFENPIATLAKSLGEEFAGRGYPVIVTADPAAVADVELAVERFGIVSRRVSGFSPWEAMHQFRGVVTVGERKQTIHAYFFNGKVPVWSISEIDESCFHMPQSILVKDIASKVNRAAFRFTADDAKVTALTAKAATKDEVNDGPFVELIQLGSTNNRSAMPILKKYADHKDRFARACALSAIGMLDPAAEIDFLKDRYAKYTDMDKFMALKAIGDAEDKPAIDFVKSQRTNPLFEKEAGFKYCVTLYGGE
jgi:hypothetical protein